MSFDKQTAANVKQAVPFFHVSNMEESLRYYEDALAIYREVTSRGIKARNPFVGNGMWVTAFRTRMASRFFSRAKRTSPRPRSIQGQTSKA
jgi:hypothetical protein